MTEKALYRLFCGTTINDPVGFLTAEKVSVPKKTVSSSSVRSTATPSGHNVHRMHKNPQDH